MDKTLSNFEAGIKAQSSFDRMEDKVMAMEAHTEALEELRNDSSQLEREFLDMETHAEIDEELKNLKQKMKTQPKTESVATSSDSSKTILL